ncbi:CbtB-domain containing protein [Streptomyces durbertensis]|uniref:CbtB-domain containing protein n=1 Tax=Streptomyces durbertensis TaxID=2448886 RepID=A0ABR6EDR9_9ACTN|nr:CbtB-domain containing protein [Streptomyces durbertensis]MBB1243485.1 CbtB-domain containing protein [Streptomyces durbertensis]
MSLHPGTGTAPVAADATAPVRDWLIAATAIVVSLIALYAVFMDNGNVIAATGEYLHEFSHDGRHLFGAPCH